MLSLCSSSNSGSYRFGRCGRRPAAAAAHPFSSPEAEHGEEDAGWRPAFVHGVDAACEHVQSVRAASTANPPGAFVLHSSQEKNETICLWVFSRNPAGPHQLYSLTYKSSDHVFCADYRWPGTSRPQQNHIYRISWQQKLFLLSHAAARSFIETVCGSTVWTLTPTNPAITLQLLHISMTGSYFFIVLLISV